MGIFSSQIEKELENIYIPMFVPIVGSSEAKKMVESLIAKAKSDAIKFGNDKTPKNFGDIILQEYSNNERTKEYIDKLKEDGVSDENIKLWWNLHYLEREMIRIVDNHFKMVGFISEVEKSGDKEKAAMNNKKYMPFFGNIDDLLNKQGEDRPLPYELKDRINIYISKRVKNDPACYKKDIENYSSLNALLREEIRNGNI